MAGKGNLRVDLEDALASGAHAMSRATYAKALLSQWQQYRHDSYALEALEELVESLREQRQALEKAYKRIERG